MAVADQRPKRSQQRGVGDLAFTEVDALAGQRVAPAFVGTRRELGHQSGLPDSGVAGHESDAGSTRFAVCESRLELGQLALATDEAGARHAGCHHSSMPR